MASTTIPDKSKPSLSNLADDDLDDLDDVLDQFDPKSLTSPPPPPPTASAATTFNRPRTNTRVDQAPRPIPGASSSLEVATEAEEDALTADFAKELAKGMEGLMRELGGPGSAEDGSGQTAEEQKAFKAAWEAMLVEGLNGVEGLDDLKPEIAEKSGVAPQSDFQKKIQETMERLKKNDANLKGGDGGAAAGTDSIEALLASMGDGGESEEDMAAFVQTMMSELMSKDVLYDPLKELAEKFPGYLASPPEPLSAEDRKRFEAQNDSVKKILAIFEQPDYVDGNPKYSEKIVDLMSEMQSHGSPPESIMGPIPSFSKDGLPDMENCVIA